MTCKWLKAPAVRKEMVFLFPTSLLQGIYCVYTKCPIKSVILAIVCIVFTLKNRGAGYILKELWRKIEFKMIMFWTFNSNPIHKYGTYIQFSGQRKGIPGVRAYAHDRAGPHGPHIISNIICFQMNSGVIWWNRRKPKTFIECQIMALNNTDLLCTWGVIVHCQWHRVLS